MKNHIINDVISHSDKNTHPRIILTENDFKRIREGDDIVYVNGRKEVIKRADEFLDKPLLVYEIPDGIRLLQVSRDTLERTLNLGMAYKLTCDDKYAERLYLELANAASYKDWNPYHFLDVGEMSCAFGIGYDWIYDYMTEEQRKLIRTAIVEKGFNAAMDNSMDHNGKNRDSHYSNKNYPNNSIL